MLEFVEASIDSSLSVEELIAFCRSAESRQCWPGAKEISFQEGGFFYTIAVRARGLPQAKVTVEEHLRPVEHHDEESLLESGLLWTWPTGEIASAWVTYRFVEDGHGARLHYSLRYLTPRSRGTQMIYRGAFGDSIRAAVDRYLECVAQKGSAITAAS